VTITPLDTHEVRFGEENTINAAEVFLAFKTLKSGKAAGCDEIWPEMLEALNQRVFWKTIFCWVLWLRGTIINISNGWSKVFFQVSD